MNRLVLFFFLLGSLFIFIGISTSPRTQVQTAREVKSAKQVQTPTPSSTTRANEQSLQVPVNRVIDGDTIDVQINGKEEKVRLIGINAPETNECFGKEATDKARELLSSKTVKLEADPTQGERDKYKRLLRYVFVEGTNFEELMVREGFAKEYTYHTAYKYQSLFKSAQKEAQDSRRGLWAVCR